MQAFKGLLGHFGLGALAPIIALGLVIASLSGLLDWLTGPSTGLVDIGARIGGDRCVLVRAPRPRPVAEADAPIRRS